jgi:16S rRNA (cytosine1402-N4)-methyltransferase
MDFKHQSIMTDEIIGFFNYLSTIRQPTIVDGTLGLGGHAKVFFENFKELKIIGIDRDQKALLIARANLAKYQSKLTSIYGRFEDVDQIFKDREINQVDGVLLDLGVSSMQLDNGSRGFSFLKEADLDMRMDDKQVKTAFEVVNNYPESCLVEIFSRYGEERFSKTIARRIIESRKRQKIETTLQLAEIVKNSLPKKFQFSKTHPATNIFRAIRIEVNDELSQLNTGIIKLFHLLKPNACLAVITFHSIEDRIVKNAFKFLAVDCICPPKTLTCDCEKKVEGKIITKKPITPSNQEININPRSRSAKLRVIKKV